MKNVMVISQDPVFLDKIDTLRSRFTSFSPAIVTSFEDAITSFATGTYQCALVDNDLYDNPTIILFFQDIKMLWPHVSRVLVLGQDQSMDLVEAINNADIQRILNKSWDLEKISAIVSDASEAADVWQELKKVKKLATVNNQELLVLNRLLEDQIITQTDEIIKINNLLSSSLFATVRAFSQAVEAKDQLTRGHSERVAQLCVEIGKKMQLSQEELNGLYIAGTLHDVGKIGISELILQKNGSLSDEEFDSVREHPLIGYNILNPIPFEWHVAKVVLQHHEYFNGKGYPYHLSGDEICLGARILHVADAYEAMTSNRPYRKAMSIQGALDELERNSGSQFDPDVVSLFTHLSITQFGKKN
ncbi:MAG: HD-GYP domain-containing protein [Candidatus Auribacterota bacterium]|jgi:HD-GYP domain-containing protein (c-di-GMP phosphodiesterase class II)